MLAIASTLGLSAAEFSPAFFWMWNRELDEAKLIAQLEDMHAHGLRSVCIHPFPVDFRKGVFESHMKPDYLTPEYLGIFAKVTKRASELGMESWLYDEGGWPSGGACCRIAREDAEGRFRFRYLTAEGEIVAGKYDALRMYPSIIENGVTERFLELTHNAYAKSMPSEVGRSVRIAFTDEPQMVGDICGLGLGWTADFAEEFRRRRGYDLVPFAKKLIGEWKSEADDIVRLKLDFQEVRGELFVERFLDPIREWCHRHGMLSGGHVNGEDMPEWTAGYGHGDILTSLRAMDVPGVDVIWRQLFPPHPGKAAAAKPFPRYAASAMHQNGGRYALTETFGIFGDSCSPEEMKWVVDYQLVRGINRFVFGYYALSNANQWMLLFEPHSGPVAPYWDFEPQFFRYIAETAAELARGRPGAEIAVLYDTRGLWAGGKYTDEAAKNHYAVASALDRLNRDYDFVNERSIAAAEVTADGKLKVGAMEYRALVLPTSRWMTDATKTKLDEFRQRGGITVDGAELEKTPVTLAITGKGCDQLRVMRRIDGETQIYFVVNEGEEECEASIDFGKSGTVRRRFGKFESVLFEDGKARGEEICDSSDSTILRLDDGWKVWKTVSHDATDDDLVVRKIDRKSAEHIKFKVKLGDWRPVLGETFSGRAVYQVEFESETGGEAVLDLGKVCWCAGVRLNGKDYGKRFFGPFRWNVGLVKGRNVLEVEVANLLATHLGDAGIRTRIAAKQPPHPGYEAKLSVYDLENRESGLFGPVEIRVGK